MKKSHLLGSVILGILLVAVTVIVLSLTGVFGSAEQTLLVISTDSQEKMYDGEPLTNYNWKIIEGQVKEGHKIVPTIFGAQTNAGTSENKMSVKIVDANQADVTGEYRVEYRPGKLTVTQRTLKVASNSASKQYDGTPIVCEAFRIVSGRLLTGHRLDVEFGMSRTEVGVSENIITVRVLDASNSDVTANYAVETLNGSLNITGYPLTIMTSSNEKVYDGTALKDDKYTILSGGLKGENEKLEITVIGEQTEVGESVNEISVQIFDKDGVDITSRYDISKVLGKLTVTKRDVTVTTDGKSVAYDAVHANGGVLQHNSYTVSDTLAQGHKANVSVTGKVEGVGSADNTCTVEIVDENGSPVTQNYNIVTEIGKLEILPVDIVITSHDAYISYKTFVESGMEPLVCDGYDESVASLLEGHKIAINITGKQAKVGYSLNEFTVAILDKDGKDVSSLYTIKPIYGILEIGPIDLTIGSSSASKEYDGEPLVKNEDGDWWIVAGSLFSGHEVTRAVFLNSITDAGSIKNQVALTICDEEGNDVTECYNFLDEFGYLEVTPLVLHATSEDYTDMYNGQVIRHEVYHITHGLEELQNRNHSVEVTFREYPINVGEYINRMGFVIKNAEGEDITRNYFVDKNEGRITIVPRVVTIRTESASKNYDGLPLTAPFWKVISETDVVDGHRIVAVVTGEQTEIGKSNNTLSELRVIVAETGQDVTLNYDLSGLQYGVLRVKDPSGIDTDVPEPETPPPGFSGENILLAKIKSTGTGSVYLREMSFGDYNGQYFDLSNSFDKLIDDTYSMHYLTSLAIGETSLTSHKMDMEFVSSRYFLPYYLDTAEADYTVQRSDVVNTDPACIDATVYYYDYWYSPTNPLPTVPQEYQDEELVYRKYVYDRYLKMDGFARTEAYMQGIIEAEGFDKNDPMILEKVAQYIQQCAKYNLDYDSDLDVEDDVVLAFMEVYGEGVCRHYAMAATLMLRTLGIPARYTVGVYSEIKNADEWTEVYSNTGHAWTEAYIDGVGWVALEVTGGDRQFPGTGNGGSGGGIGPGGGGGGGGAGPTKLEITPVVNPVQYYEGAVLVADKTNTYFTGNQDFRDLLNIGYYVECDISGSIDTVGYGTVTISNVKLFNDAGKDVTKNYIITTNTGRLHLYEKTLNITSGSITTDYTGKLVTCETYESTPLISPTHYLEVTFGSGRTEAGSTQNYFTCKVFEGEGDNKKDVTYKYYITKRYGQIYVNFIELTLTADTTVISYDQLINEYGGIYEAYYFGLEGELFEGHEFEYVEQSGSLEKKGRQETIITDVKIVDQDGNDVTSNYKITFKKGLIRVTR